MRTPQRIRLIDAQIMFKTVTVLLFLKRAVYPKINIL